MPTDESPARVYRELADWYEQNEQAQMRDRFLVLAADALFAEGRRDEAERLRGRLLQTNPHHLLKPYASFAEAMKTADVQNYVQGLRRTYPADSAGLLLESLRHPQAGDSAGAVTPEAAPGRPAGSAEERVYRLRDDDRPARKRTPFSEPLKMEPIPARRPQPSAPSAKPARELPTPSWPDSGPAFAWRNGPPDADGREPVAGAWVATILFWVLLILGLLTAAFALGRAWSGS